MCVVQTLGLVLRDLINPRPAPQPQQQGALAKALELSRLMLFELDVRVATYVNSAHMVVLINMWRMRQPAAGVSVAKHCLGLRLEELMTTQLSKSPLAADSYKEGCRLGAGLVGGGTKPSLAGWWHAACSFCVALGHTYACTHIEL